MQGQNENLLTSTDKMKGFHSKVQLWKQHVECANLDMFPHTQKWQGVNSAALCETMTLVDAAVEEDQELPKGVSEFTNRPDLSEQQQEELCILLLK